MISGLDFTIRVGDIVQIGGIAGVMVFGWFKFKSHLELKLQNHSDRLTNIERSMSDTQKLVTQMAVQSVEMSNQNKRMDNIEDDLRDLRHGRGFVVDTKTLATILAQQAAVS